MTKLIIIYRALVQVTFVGVLLFTGFILLQVKWPGYQTYTDNDAGLFYYISVVFMCALILLFLNSVLFYFLKHWRIYRLYIACFTVLLLILVILPREYFVKALLSNEQTTYKSEFNNESLYYINIRLFEAGKFLAETSDFEYTVENIGDYLIEHDTLTLKFKNLKSNYIGSKFLIINNELHCIDCSEEIDLKAQVETKQSKYLHAFPEINLKSILENLFI